MAINPADITTVRVDQLASDAITLTSLLPHQVGTDLKQDTVQSLVDLVATAIGTGSGVGYLPISVTDGQQLPDVPTDPSFFLCGAGTYLNINGFPNVICTGELNAVMSLPDHWELAVEIPIVAEVGVQTVTGSAVDNTDPLNPVINEIIDGVQTIVAGTNVTVDNTDPLNPIVSATGGGGSQNLQQTMELGRTYTETVGDYTYNLKFISTGGQEGHFQLNTVNNDTGFGSYIELTEFSLLTTINDSTNNKSIEALQDFTDGYKITVSDDSTSENFVNQLIVPIKTAETGTSSFSIPNNKPAGDYTLATTDDIPTIDATPTDGSSNAVSSNGVFDALATKVSKSDYTPSHSILVQQSGTGSPTSLQVGNNTLVGRVSGGGSDIDDLSTSQVRTMLSINNVDNTSDDNKPVSTATQTALDLKADKSSTPSIVIRNITPSTALTGTTSETQITSFNFTIPANTFSANDILKVETIAWEKSGTANASTCRIKLSNTNNYAGASNVLILAASANNINMRGTRTYKIAGGNLKGFMSASANGIFNDNTLTNVAVSTLALDVTQPIYGFVSLNNTSSADSTIVNELIISKW